jgi:hypothetical protein
MLMGLVTVLVTALVRHLGSDRPALGAQVRHATQQLAHQRTRGKPRPAPATPEASPPGRITVAATGTSQVVSQQVGVTVPAPRGPGRR